VDLPALLESHWLGCMASAGGGGQVTRIPGAVVLHNPRFRSTLLNFMALRGAAPGQLAATLEMGGAILAGAERPPALFLSPASGELNLLREALLALRWRCHTTQAVLSRELPGQEGEGSGLVQVREVGPSELGCWADTLVRAYEVAPGPGGDMAEAWSLLLSDPGVGAEARLCLGFVEGEPVGTGLLWLQGAIAGLYCGAVLPAFRRRGVERATLLARLAWAASAGARLAFLQTDAGSPVEHLCCNRLGFSQSHRRELWLPPAPRQSR